MPCYDYYEDELQRENAKKVVELEKDHARLVDKCHMLTALLCEATAKLKQSGHLYDLSKELQRWTTKHEEDDKKPTRVVRK